MSESWGTSSGCLLGDCMGKIGFKYWVIFVRKETGWYIQTMPLTHKFYQTFILQNLLEPLAQHCYVWLHPGWCDYFGTPSSSFWRRCLTLADETGFETRWLLLPSLFLVPRCPAQELDFASYPSCLPRLRPWSGKRVYFHFPLGGFSRATRFWIFERAFIVAFSFYPIPGRFYAPLLSVIFYILFHFLLLQIQAKLFGSKQVIVGEWHALFVVLLWLVRSELLNFSLFADPNSHLAHHFFRCFSFASPAGWLRLCVDCVLKHIQMVFMKEITF